MSCIYKTIILTLSHVKIESGVKKTVNKKGAKWKRKTPKLRRFSSQAGMHVSRFCYLHLLSVNRFNIGLAIK